MSRALVVVDLGYGDAGKGTTVDWLVRRYGGAACSVVRFNGGPQAEHNVVLPGGVRHGFSTWGSGTLAGAPTHLARHVLVNPLNAYAEAEGLRRVGVRRPFEFLSVDERCPIITPWHVGVNQVREQWRVGGRHGSCGQGVGATMEDVLAGTALRVADLEGPPMRLLARLAEVQEAKEAVLMSEFGAGVRDAPAWAEFFPGDPRALLEWYRGFVASVHVVRAGTAPWRAETVVFEGAQGVLIDQTHGDAPHNTWSDCTFRNAEDELLEADWPGDVVRLGVTRTYMVRHGPGAMPTESARLTEALLPEPHNQTNLWQGWFRRGFADFPSLQRAVACCGGVDGLVLTHADLGMPLGRWRVATGQDVVGLVANPMDVFARELQVPLAAVSWGPTYQQKAALRCGPLQGRTGRVE